MVFESPRQPRMWTPPRPYPPSSTTSSPSRSLLSTPRSEGEVSPARNVSLEAERNSSSRCPLWYGTEQWLVIFHAGGQQWQLPHNPFSQKSSVLQQFLDSPFNNSSHFDHSIDGASGLQMIELLDVDKADAEAFLKALYIPDFFERPLVSGEASERFPTSLDTVLAILKLSTKYEIHYLRKRALAHLSLAYPTTLKNWEQRLSRANFPLTAADSHQNSLYFATPAEVFEVIKVARDCQAPWILPSALYECCKYDLETLSRHPHFQDGTIDDDLRIKILVGHTEQKDLSTSEVLNFLRIPLKLAKSEGCCQLSRCADARIETEKTVLKWTSLQWPLELWNEHGWDDEHTREMCRVCRRLCVQALQEERSKAWERLPEIFRLPSWQTLQDMEKADLQA